MVVLRGFVRGLGVRSFGGRRWPGVVGRLSPGVRCGGDVLRRCVLDGARQGRVLFGDRLDADDGGAPHPAARGDEVGQALDDEGAALALRALVMGDQLGVLARADGAPDERVGAAAAGDPGAERVEDVEVDEHVGLEAGQLARLAGAVEHVGVGRHHHADLGAGVLRVVHAEDDAVLEQVGGGLAHREVLDLRELLPGAHRLQAGGAMDGEHARERRAEQQVRLVDLQRDPDAVGLGLLLLVGEGGVEAAQQPGQDLDGVALADASARAANDEDVALGDDVVQRALERVVEHPVDGRHAEQRLDLVARRVELDRRLRARVLEVAGQRLAEEDRREGELAVRVAQLGDAAAHRVLVREQQPVEVAHGRHPPLLVGEHERADRRLAQVAVRGGHDRAVLVGVAEALDDGVGDRVGAAGDEQRVDADLGLGEVEDPHPAMARDDRQRLVGEVALGVQHDQAAARRPAASSAHDAP